MVGDALGGVLGGVLGLEDGLEDAVAVGGEVGERVGARVGELVRTKKLSHFFLHVDGQKKLIFFRYQVAPSFIDIIFKSEGSVI